MIRDLMKKNEIAELIYQTLQNLNLKKENSMYDCVKFEITANESTDTHENTMSNSDGFLEKNEELNRNLFENNETNRLFYEEKDELFVEKTTFNIDDFINHDYDG